MTLSSVVFPRPVWTDQPNHLAAGYGAAYPGHGLDTAELTATASMSSAGVMMCAA